MFFFSPLVKSNEAQKAVSSIFDAINSAEIFRIFIFVFLLVTIIFFYSWFFVRFSGFIEFNISVKTKYRSLSMHEEHYAYLFAPISNCNMNKFVVALRK